MARRFAETSEGTFVTTREYHDGTRVVRALPRYSSVLWRTGPSSGSRLVSAILSRFLALYTRGLWSVFLREFLHLRLDLEHLVVEHRLVLRLGALGHHLLLLLVELRRRVLEASKAYEVLERSRRVNAVGRGACKPTRCAGEGQPPRRAWKVLGEMLG